MCFFVLTVLRFLQIIDACNRFNGRYPVKGMPPGIFSEDEEKHQRIGSVHIALLMATVCLIALAGYKTVKNRRGVRTWQAVSDKDAASSQVRGAQARVV